MGIRHLQNLLKLTEIPINTTINNSSPSVSNTQLDSASSSLDVSFQTNMVDPSEMVDTGKIECDICHKRVLRIKEHIERHLRSGEREFICTVCGKSYLKKEMLNRHILNHDPDKKKHKCDICGQGFPRNDQLKRHKISHSATASFKCDYCDKSFKRKDGLDRHIRDLH
jgi:uncharacterized Zn-finger protein